VNGREAIRIGEWAQHFSNASCFTRDITIPLIKNNKGNKTSSDNYRGITLSPVLSKLFKMVLLSDLQKDLYSDCLVWF